MTNQAQPADFSTTACRYTQAGREAYVFSMTLGDVDDILPTRAPEDLNTIKGVNRALTLSHAKNIQDYLQENPDWVLGSIILAAPPEAVDNTTAGEITIPSDKIPSLKIIDGQHRRRAIADLLANLRATEAAPDELEGWRKKQLSVCLYTVETEREMRQMFASLALAKPINRNTQNQFDMTNPFNNVAHQVIEDSRLLQHRVEPNKSTLPSAAPYLLTHNDVADIVNILTLGWNKKITPDLKRLYLEPERQADMLDRATKFFDVFLTQISKNLEDFASERQPREKLALLRSDDYKMEPAIIKLMANCYHDWTLSDTNTALLTQYVTRSMNFNRASPIGFNAVTNLQLLDTSKTRASFLKKNAPEWQMATTNICQAARGANQPREENQEIS